MKKNISINISGIIFHVEEDGYERLQNYLESIGRYFSTFEDNKEIVADIENRIAEIFLSKLNDGKQVINAEDIDGLIATMGTISDFEAIEQESTFTEEAHPPKEEADESTESSEEQASDSATAKGSKRLFRDGKRKVLGGVCSGIAHYFSIDPLWIRLLFILFFVNVLLGGLSGIIFIAYIVLWIVVPINHVLDEDQKIKKMFRNPDQRVLGGVAGGIASYFGTDVTLIRLLFVISIFLGGTGLILYVILWIITPEAKSITEKMQMQGEPVTLSNIEQNVKKSLNVNEGEENVFVKILLFPFRVIAAVFGAAGKILGPFLAFLLEAVRILAGIVLLLIGASLVIGLLTFLLLAMGIVGGWTAFVTMSDVPLELISNTIPTLTAFFIFLGALIPALVFILGGLSIIAKRSVVNSSIAWVIFGIWIISLIGISFTVPRQVQSWTRDGEYREEKTYDLAENVSTLTLTEVGNDDYEGVSLKLRGHADSTYKLIMRYEARGSSRQDAATNAQMITYNIVQRDSTLYFDSNIAFKDDAIFRAQQLDLTLYIPYGAEFIMDESLQYIIRNTIYRSGYRVSDMDGNRWTMDTSGIKCLTCFEAEYEDSDMEEDAWAPLDGDGDTERFNFRNFDEIEATFRFDLEIIQSNEYSVVAQGPSNKMQNLKARQSGDKIMFDFDERNWRWFDNDNDPRVKIFITTPDLTNLDLSGACTAKVRGFEQNQINISLTGASEADMSVDAERLVADAQGASKLKLFGEGKELDVKLTGASSLEAYEYEVDYAEIVARGASNAEVYVNKELDGEATGISNIKYQGDGEVQRNRRGASGIRRG
ncbi:MAG: PspC domain-containing protein [Bacteroidota bacterium]